MNIREVNVIKSEIKDVDAILININKSLAKKPDNFGLNLDLKTFQKRKRELSDELAHAYDKVNISVMEMHFTGDDVGYGEMPIAKLGKILSNTQPMLSAFSVESEIKKNAAIPDDILDSTEMLSSVVSASSVSILLRNNYSDYMGINKKEIPIKKAFKNLEEVIQCGDDYNKLQKRVETMNDKAVINYRNFVNSLKETKISVEFVNPLKNELNSEKSFKIDRKKASKIFKVITNATEKKERIVVSGMLLGSDIDSQKIKIECGDRNKNISIDFEDRLENKVAEIKVKSTVSVEFLFTKKISELESKITRKRELISIEKIR